MSKTYRPEKQGTNRPQNCFGFRESTKGTKENKNTLKCLKMKRNRYEEALLTFDVPSHQGGSLLREESKPINTNEIF